MSEMSEPTRRGDENRDMDELLFAWILDLENLARVISPEYQLDALFEIRRSMIERLRALGGEWADRLE